VPTDAAHDAQAIAAAGDLARQYGEDAAIIATLRAAEEAARGDGEASDFWVRVCALLEAGESSGMLS